MLFDSSAVKFLISFLAYHAGMIFFHISLYELSFRLLKYAHQTAGSRTISKSIQQIIRRNLPQQVKDRSGGFEKYLENHVANSKISANAVIANDPQRMLKNMAIVVASAHCSSARGIIILCYNYAFPLFAREFDVKKVIEKYHLVLEPSWSGYCTEELLCYTLWRPATVFVEAYEPRDKRFIEGIDSGLKTVPLSANWWVDHRIFSPDHSVEKDLDFIMVASWANFKRHHRFFKVLRDLRRRGHRLQGACVGYPGGLTLDDIRMRAEWYGVSDQITFYEFISQIEIAHLMNRAKVNIVWSRREGVNRVIIEGMFCNVPCIIPDGFNYGYRYPYVNEETGRWSDDLRLASDLLEMTQNRWPGSPSNWVHRHMTPQHAGVTLRQSIARHCEQSGEPMPGRIALKINGLHGQEYWEPDDVGEFAADYSYLKRLLTS